MAYTTINKPNTQFNTVLWTGNGGTQTITGVGFQPSLVWGKSRSVNYEQSWIDFVRGGTKYLFSNGTSAESTDANAIQSFNADGITIGSSPYIGNANGATYVGWNWLASNSTVSNTSGTISSTVSANPTSGFSIVSYTGTGSIGNIGHGLGVAPKMVIYKNRSSSTFWYVYNQNIGNNFALYLNATNAKDSDPNVFQSTDPSSSLLYVGVSPNVNGSGNNIIAYCFAEVKGYSKFGSYTGNGSSLGNFIYTGFKPAFVLVKSTTSADNWFLMDNKRDPFNPDYKILSPNTNSAEDTANLGVTDMDFLSNGFRLTTSWSGWNNNGQVNIYMAFAENPFVTSGGIPTTAR
jgi:hypothetical protein